jgi:hypothetical protein
MTKDIQQVTLKNGQEMNYMKGTDGRNVFFKEAKFMSKFTFYLVLFLLLFNVLANIYIGSLISDSNYRIMTALKLIYAENHITQEDGQTTLNPTIPPP